MSDLEKILLTSSLTIFGGITIYMMGQIFLKFILEPIHEQMRVIGEIDHALLFYGNTYGNPERGFAHKGKEVEERFRELSSLLLSRTRPIRCYRVFSTLSLIRPKDTIRTAARGLMGISNNINLAPTADIQRAVAQNVRWRDEIREALKLEDL